MALLFEGTLTLDGQAIPARLELAIGAPELASLLARVPAGGQAAAMGSGIAGNGDACVSARSRDTAAPRPDGRTWSIAEAGEHRAAPEAARPAGPAKQRPAGFEPIEVRDHPGRRIKLHHLEQISDPAKIWSALAERFPWAGFKVPSGTPALTAGDLAGAGDVDHPAKSDEAISQLDSDWATIEPHLDELVTGEGRPARGYQSRIAEMLGGDNGGHFRRTRVEPVVTRFKEWIRDEWVFTSSSPPGDDDDESAETGETRAA